MSRKFILISTLTVLFTVGFFTVANPAQALTFDDIITGAKKFILGEEKKEVTVDSIIELAPGGDVEKNDQIDAGDTIRLTFEVKNTTDKGYSFSTLKTNIDRTKISYIHNVYGVTGITNDDNTVTFPNFRIDANQVATVTFDALINYYTEEDPVITTETEFLDNRKNLIAKGLKKEIKAKRISKDKVPGVQKPNTGLEVNQ